VFVCLDVATGTDSRQSSINRSLHSAAALGQ